MPLNDLLTLLLLVVALFISTPLLGRYLAAVYGGGAAPGDRFFRPVERRLYRLIGVREDAEQRWTSYAKAMVAFSAVSVALLYGLQRLQRFLPLNPTHVGNVSPLLSLNTAISFVTNTNWQSYTPETTMSYFTQMMGLTVQNFLSASVGLALAVCLVRGILRSASSTIGNFWVDLVRGVLRILLPLSILIALLFVAQGAIQNFSGSTVVHTLDPTVTHVVNGHSVSNATQSIPGGPFASQEAIKILGTNGGGTFNANSAHPFSNPTAVTNFLQIWLMLSIPFALAYMFGALANNRRQGWTLFLAMFVVWFSASFVAMASEANGNDRLTRLGVSQVSSPVQSGGNLEGIEVRFGAGVTGIFAASTSGTSTGAVDGQMDSLTPLAGGVALLDMSLGEVSPGGIGVGLAGLLVLALLAVFLAGLMVGRTPEFMGKKIQATEMKLVVLYILVMPAIALTGAAISSVIHQGVSSIENPGPHGFSEILYAFLSASNNNGSAFGGLNANTPWFNLALSACMWIGRFFLAVPVIAIAGSLAKKKTVPVTAGTLPTDTALFGGLIVGVTFVVAGLTFFPALALGPLVEFLTH